MIAITSTGNKLNSLIDLRFTKCPYFGILKESETQFIQNPFCDKNGDIAALLVQWLKKQGVTLLITGEICSLAKKSLKNAHIQTLLIDNDKSTMQTIQRLW